MVSRKVIIERRPEDNAYDLGAEGRGHQKFVQGMAKVYHTICSLGNIS